MRTKCWNCFTIFSYKCPRCNKKSIYDPCRQCKNKDRYEKNYKAQYEKQKSGYNKKPEIDRKCPATD